MHTGGNVLCWVMTVYNRYRRLVGMRNDTMSMNNNQVVMILSLVFRRSRVQRIHQQAVAAAAGGGDTIGREKQQRVYL